MLPSPTEAQGASQKKGKRDIRQEDEEECREGLCPKKGHDITIVLINCSGGSTQR